MTNPTAHKFRWDTAISVCKEDIEFARKLVKAINPNLKVFFYEFSQEELIGRSGPEAFAKIFKTESRVVVILSRNEWSKTYYTEIERNAIMDRTKLAGYHFLIVMPMKEGEIPPWYPETQIYASPFRFTIEELAHFIEFKVADEGGIVIPLTLEERYQNLITRIEEKKTLINLQHDAVAIQSARDEMVKLKDCFNKKSEFLQKSIFDQVVSHPFHNLVNTSYIGYGDYLLECQFALPDEVYNRIVTTQDFFITFELFQTFGNHQTKKLLEREQRTFYYTPQLRGWALPHLYEQATNKDLQVLFHDRDNSKYYDLINPLRTAFLVDNWFQRLLSYFTKTIEKYI